VIRYDVIRYDMTSLCDRMQYNVMQYYAVRSTARVNEGESTDGRRSVRTVRVSIKFSSHFPLLFSLSSSLSPLVTPFHPLPSHSTTAVTSTPTPLQNTYIRTHSHRTYLASRAAAMVGAGTDLSAASCIVQRPVPFMPVWSEMLSTRYL
jgi:hypothetical protein